MAVEAMGSRIRIPQGDTGNVKFIADETLREGDRALFTIARRSGGTVLRKVLLPDMNDNAFHMPFVYGETASMRPDSYEWSLRVVRDGSLNDGGYLTDTRECHAAILRGVLTVLPVAGGAR